MRAEGVRWHIWGIVFLLGACDGGNPSPTPVTLFDVGPRDSTSGDSSSDAGADAAMDGSASSDGGDGGVVSICTHEVLDLAHGLNASPRPVSVQALDSSFNIAWSRDVRAEGQGPVETIEMASVPLSGDPSTPIAIQPNVRAQAPTLVEGMAAWIGEGQGSSSDIYLQSLDGSATSGEARRWNTPDSEQRKPKLVKLAEGYLLMSVHLNNVTDIYSIHATRLNNSGDVVVDNIVADNLIIEPADMDASAYGENAVAVVWSEVGAAVPINGVYFQQVDLNGSPAGQPKYPVHEYDLGWPSGAVGIAADERKAFVIFERDNNGNRNEVMFRIVPLNYDPENTDHTKLFGVRALNARGSATAPSIQAFAGGIVATYRGKSRQFDPENPNGGEEKTGVWASFINSSSAEIIENLLLDESDYSSAATSIGVAPDGTLLVGWSNSAPESGTNFVAARVNCPGAWLRCGAKPF